MAFNWFWKKNLTGQWCRHKCVLLTVLLDKVPGFLYTWLANVDGFSAVSILQLKINQQLVVAKQTVLKMIISFSASDFNVNPCDLRSILTVHYKCKLISQWPVLEPPSPLLSFWTHSPAVLQSNQAQCQPKVLALGTGDQGLMYFSLNSYEVL